MKPPKMPYLLVRDGEVVKVCYVPDPRGGIVEAFKRINEGFSAVPVTPKSAKAWERKLCQQAKTGRKAVQQ